MNNFYTRVVVKLILGIALIIGLIAILHSTIKSNEQIEPKKQMKFEKKRLFVDLPEEEISKDENNPDTVVMFVRNDTLYVGYFSEY